ncbi:hypothetical protein [Natronococcus jeotgali]|uniref:Domain of unknown function domain-containing protein n=1 Tax=Natronococcus jeotgali DSM 18795 TaxID=1227498 RepID=L9XJD7_9EURY|nr:hypothetical protein [Natronococcus jeotgali]ELY61840.1 hypothetical protein C492_09045 [Natronococcus jeotgali DSM 18795]
MTGRKNAMLTTEDRRWLTGEKVYDGQHAKQQRYQRRRDIRERVYNSMLDFSILIDELDDDEWRDIFGEVTDGGQQWQNVEEDLQTGVRDGLAFLLRTIGVATLMRDGQASQITVPERLLTAALRRAGHRDGLLVESAFLDIEATDVGIPKLLEDLQSDEPMSAGSLYLLMESGAVDTDVVQDCLRDHLLEDGSEEI